jgi:hypothetical protein
MSRRLSKYMELFVALQANCREFDKRNGRFLGPISRRRHLHQEILKQNQVFQLNLNLYPRERVALIINGTNLYAAARALGNDTPQSVSADLANLA